MGARIYGERCQTEQSRVGRDEVPVRLGGHGGGRLRAVRRQARLGVIESHVSEDCGGAEEGRLLAFLVL